MGYSLRYTYGLLCALVLMPTISYSQLQDFTSSRATFYGSPDFLGTRAGACGLGDYGRTLNHGYVAGVSRLYWNGTGCGACYQIRCKAPQLCTDDGVNVVVTDYGEGDKTDFILSTTAYASMARPNMSADLFANGVVAIEYRRIRCRYPEDYDLVFMVHDDSKFPDYLAIAFLYLRGVVADVLAIDIWEGDRQEWRGMRKAYGAVWDMASPPKGDLTLRVKLYFTRTYFQRWFLLDNAIPGNWTVGATYGYKSVFQL